MQFIDLTGKVVLVTGGTGSFGRRFIETVLERFDVAKLIIFSRDEAKQYEMQNDPVLAPHLKKLRFFIGDVRDLDRLTMAFNNVDYVVHAAAMKHITIAEYNPFECIRTNVHGAENVVTAAIRAGVSRVVALSTDKAANPINLYGASKLAADKIFMAAHNVAGIGGPKFSVVRYGNVLGSRGSVVLFFQELVARGAKSLPITDERMTRFWITLDQGVDFVLSTLDLMKGSEIFVPKIPSMGILDMASAIGPGIQTNIIGMRPGEKINEEMITSADARSTLELPDRFVILPGDTKRSGYHSDEKPVDAEFHYSSDGNPDWLSVEEMRYVLSGNQRDLAQSPAQ